MYGSDFDIFIIRYYGSYVFDPFPLPPTIARDLARSRLCVLLCRVLPGADE